MRNTADNAGVREERVEEEKGQEGVEKAGREKAAEEEKEVGERQGPPLIPGRNLLSALT